MSIPTVKTRGRGLADIYRNPGMSKPGTDSA